MVARGSLPGQRSNVSLEYAKRIQGIEARVIVNIVRYEVNSLSDWKPRAALGVEAARRGQCIMQDSFRVRHVHAGQADLRRLLPAAL